MVRRRQGVHRRRDAFVAGLQLQRQKLRVVPRLVQVAAVEPQVGLLGGLPHVAQLSFPGAGVLGGARPQAPALAHLVGHGLRHDPGHPLVHRAVAGGVHQHIGRQLGAVAQHHRARFDLLDVAAGQLDTAIGHQLAGAHVDVVARATAQVFHEQARAVVTEVELEAGLLQA